MKIDGLHVDGFGVWSGLELAQLSEQVTVFYGPNEAGKTTLLQFLRSMLYGFSLERRARYLPPVHGGPAGGSLRLNVDSETLVVTRLADPSNASDTLSVVRAGYENGDAADLQSIEGGSLADHILSEMDEQLFTSVFAIGLREIQELGTLDDSEAARLLYDLSLGLERVSLNDVLTQLTASRMRLLAPDARPALIPQLLGQRESLQAEIQELQQLTPRFLALTVQRGELDREIGQRQGQRQELEQHAQLLEAAHAVREPWTARAALDRELSLMAPLRPMPQHALERLERMNARLAVWKSRRKQLRASRKPLGEEAALLKINNLVCRNAPRIEALAEQQPWLVSLAEQVKKLEDDVRSGEEQIASDLRQWGLPATYDAAKPLSIAPQAEAALRSQAKALARARKDLAETRKELELKQQEAKSTAGQIRAALGQQADEGLGPALERAGELISALRNRIKLDERLDQLSRRESDLDEQSQIWLSRQILPGWVLASLGSLFVLGFALIVAGLLLPASITGVLGWPLALLGAGGTAAAGLTKAFMERSATRQLDVCSKQIEIVNGQIDQAREERDELDQKLPRGGGPLVVRLQGAEKEIALLEELLPLQARCDAAQRQSRDCREREKVARSQYRAARQRWRQSLSEARLPDTLRPGQWRDLHSHLSGLAAAATRLGELRGEADRRRRDYLALTTRIDDLSKDIGLTPSLGEPADRLKDLLGNLRQQQGFDERRRELHRQVAQVKDKETQCSRIIAKLRHRRKVLLHAAGVSNEPEFRRLAQAQAEATRLSNRRSEFCLDITRTLGSRFSEDDIGPALQSADLDGLRGNLSERIASAASEIEGLCERRGTVKEQLAAMADDRRLAHKRIDLSIVDQKLHDSLERWRVLAICEAVLQDVREAYQRDRQPEVLRDASQFLARLTGDRYTRVWTPVGDRALRVDDAQGRALPIEFLSQGTREQLFLSLRLALVSIYARRGIELPLILDDVLVNFDAARCKAAVGVLRDFARQGHQLLVFTCHEHIAKLFKGLRTDVRHLPDNAHPDLPAADFDEPIKKPRKARQELPVPAQHLPEPPVVQQNGESTLPQTLPVEEAEVLPPPSTKEQVPTAMDHGPSEQRRPRRTPAAVTERVERIRWDAEEFEGELADRVRRFDPPHVGGFESQRNGGGRTQTPSAPEDQDSPDGDSEEAE